MLSESSSDCADFEIGRFNLCGADLHSLSWMQGMDGGFLKKSTRVHAETTVISRKHSPCVFCRPFRLQQEMRGGCVMQSVRIKQFLVPGDMQLLRPVGQLRAVLPS